MKRSARIGKWTAGSVVAAMMISGGVVLADENVEEGIAPAPAPVEAPEPAPTDEGTGTTDPAAVTSAKVNALAVKYAADPVSVATMQTSGMGWGEIDHALGIAQRMVLDSQAGTPIEMSAAIDDVMALRASGMGWGEIAKAKGYKLGDIVSNSHKKVEPVETGDVDVPETGAISKPDRPERPEVDRSGRPDSVGKPEGKGRPEGAGMKPSKTDVDRPGNPGKGGGNGHGRPDRPHGNERSQGNGK